MNRSLLLTAIGAVILTELPARPAGTDLADLLPDQWVRYTAGPVPG
jgi:hypothetical protein